MNLYNLFDISLQNYPDNICLVVNNKSYTYCKFSKKIGRIASILKDSTTDQVALFTNRSWVSYASLLASLKAGKTYVPLNIKFPVLRNKQIVELSKAKVIIVDESCIEMALELARELKERFVFVFPENEENTIPDFIIKNHEVICAKDLVKELIKITVVDPHHLAYILFTSGSTGKPKGVPISHQNVLSYTEYLYKRYEVQPADRFSHTPDLTFDLSVHDMYLCWRGGAALYCIPENVLIAPAKFIKQHELTMWCSVPSMVQIMGRFKMLKPNNFPSIRWSVFCGEPLPKSVAIQWQIAAKNSLIDNVYGPTETTVSITHYTLPMEPSEIKEKNGIVSIGTIFKTQEYCLLDDNNQLVFKEGEMCLSGSQVANGYWENKEASEKSFVDIYKNGSKKWYKTGDIIQEEKGLLYFKQRKDFQVKIRGYSN